MNSGKKISHIAWLMMVSELLIVLFVWRWLQSEYNSEKVLLQKNLFDQFIEAKASVMDSLISKNIINPILDETSLPRMKSQHDSNRSVDKSYKVVAFDTTVDTSKIDSLHTKITMKHLHKMNIDEEMDIHISDDSVDDRLYRGVKLFISRAGGPGGTSDFFDRHLESGDTTLLKKFFAENLHKQQFDVKTKWIRDVPEKNFPPPPFYYESHFFEQPFGVRIEDYNRFITMKIIPQIGFAVLLLLITSGAFLFAFQSLRSQKQLAVMKDDFISNMSHELKTPLATMQVAVEAMQQMEPATQNETLKDYLGMTAQELVRLDVLVHKVMSTMLPDHANTSIYFETINLRQLIEQTIQSLALVLDQRNATVNFSSKTSDLFINGEAIHLQGIFHNLIDNSLKYGKERPEISIAFFQSANGVTVIFEDNGPGIPEAYLNKVFDKFFRVPSGNLHEVKGYGLGLHYVSQVMLQHNGHVTVKNFVEGGCRFTLTFPSIT